MARLNVFVWTHFTTQATYPCVLKAKEKKWKMCAEDTYTSRSQYK